MGLRMRDAVMGALDELRYEPSEKRLRAMLGDQTVIDSGRALLVWEPRRVVPPFAVPLEDVRGQLDPATADVPGRSRAGDPPPPGTQILHPGIPFSAHSTPGEPLTLRAAEETREAAAFRPADPDLNAHVVLDFHAFDAWYEEDEPVLGHPRDPFHRVDILASSRHVRIELDGQLVAESTRPHLVFETHMPVRFYLPPADLRVSSRPASRRTICAYKGEASYLSLDLDGGPRDDLVWTYPTPLRDATALAGLVAFFDEKVDVVVDGELRERPHTAVSAAVVEESDG